MGAITQYSLQVALLLAAIFLIYRWTLAGSTFCRFNRCVIICGYVAAFIAIPVWSWLSTPRTVDSTESVMAEIDNEIAMLTDSAAPSWPTIVTIVYLSGIIVATILTLRSVYKLYRIIHYGNKTKNKEYTLVLTEQRDISPFSWGRYIVLPQGARQDDIQMIESHERAHLRHRHWIDLILGQIVIIFNWFNPAAYLMMKELQDVHEFEADKDVIKTGIDEKQYQMMLLRNATGSLFPMFADSLNHSQLKTRLKLMMASQSNQYRKLSAALLAPAVIAVAIGLNTPLMASNLGAIAGATIFQSECDEVRYTIEGDVHAIIYDQEGMTTSVSMDVEPGTSPQIYINRHIASRDELRNIKSKDVIFALCDNINNRFVIKTK